MGSRQDLMTSTSTEIGSGGLPTRARQRRDSINEAGAGRIIKHRSSQACQSCRSRKVRCDVITNGFPCTNCRLDSTECVVVASRRGKNNHSHRNSLSQVAKRSSPRSVPVRHDSSSTANNDDAWRDKEETEDPTSPSDIGHVPACVTFDEDSDKVRSDQELVDDNTTLNDMNHASSEPYDELPTPETRTGSSNHGQIFADKALLPAFIYPLSHRIPREDIDFLIQKGAFTMPEPELRAEILRAYMFSVQPFMPMLEFRDFIPAVLGSRADLKVSLLLFQAVMFAGLHSLQPNVVRQLGFNTVKQARRVFFDRVRLLYEFEIEADSAAVLQSLILMSSWYGKWDDRKHTWHWTGLAYDLARSMGLHREPTSIHMSDSMKRFRRRLWWSLYIRDRMIALGTRRPMRIRDDEFEVAALTLEDFDIEALEDLRHGQAHISNTEQNTSVALMCIQLIELCKIIGHVVSSQYTVLGSNSHIPHTMMMVPKCNRGDMQELDKYDDELNGWFQALDSSVRRAHFHTIQSNDHYNSGVHWAILNMTYLTVVNVLHRAAALQPRSTTLEAQKERESSRSKVKDAARRLTKISQDMLRHDQVRFLGPIGITALNAACLSHMLDASSSDEDVRDASILRLYQSFQVLQLLRGIYAAADASFSFLASITQKAGIPLPVHFATPAAELDKELMKPSVGNIASIAWTQSLEPHSGEINVPIESADSFVAYREDGLQSLVRPSRHYERLERTLDGGRRLVRTNTLMQPVAEVDTVNLPGVALTASNEATRTNRRQYNSVKDNMNADPRATYGNDINYGQHSGSVPDRIFFDWDNGMDVGMDFEPIAFNYDFFSNAFNYPDSQPPGNR